MTSPQTRPESKRPLPKTVLGLGWVSLLTDLSSEAMFPLLPIFLVGIGAGTTFVGAVEGTAELVASLLKYLSGTLSDRFSKKKPLVLLGYGISTLARPLMAICGAPWQVLVIRVLDRVGKGIRTSPRDALILRATDRSMRARAYGFHRAMDHGGAALGTLFAATILYILGAKTEGPSIEMLRTVFLWAAVPGLCAMLALWLTPEPRGDVIVPTGIVPDSKLEVPGGKQPSLVPALVPVLLFGFANATDAFLIVKATELGMSSLYAPLLWLCLHIVKSGMGAKGGQLADRHGRRNLLLVGWTLYALTWGSIGFATTIPTLFVMTSLYGLCHGLVEGAEKALIAERIPGGKAGKGFGTYNMSMGIVALASGTSFGYVWQSHGSSSAFAAWGAVALVAALTLLLWVPSDGGSRGQIVNVLR